MFIPKKFKALNLLNVLTKWQRGLDWNAVYLENHDQPRIVSHYGDDSEYWERSAKLLATMQLTLRGTPFIYQGQELGMTNCDFQSLSQLDDIVSHNIDKAFGKMGIPAKLRWKWIKLSSRDNSRTPMQWSPKPGAGFTDGKPWFMINENHTKINYLEQQNRESSILNYYKSMIALRAGSETLKYGEFSPLSAKGGVTAYTRTLGRERYVVILNFSRRPGRCAQAGEVAASNTGRNAYDGSLAPYEAVVLRQSV
jgi:oligo-1,6-glucosidase